MIKVTKTILIEQKAYREERYMCYKKIWKFPRNSDQRVKFSAAKLKKNKKIKIASEGRAKGGMKLDKARLYV